MEIQGTLAQTITGADTLFTDIPVLQPDTSPARVTRADLLDSATIVLTFDDFLDPTSPLPQVAVRPSSGRGGALGIQRIFSEPDYGAWVEQVRTSLARLDSMEAAAAEQARALAARDTAAPADTSQVTDTVEAAVSRSPSQGASPSRPAPPPQLPRLSDVRAGVSPDGGGLIEGPDGRPLPGRRLVVVVRGALVPDSTYQVTASGVDNVNGVPGGGGEAEVVRAAPRDTATAHDTTFVPDTAAVRDTVSPPDTVPPPDTIPPDTGRVFLPGRRR